MTRVSAISITIHHLAMEVIVYQRIQNNFLQTMSVNDARKAVGMFKDEYLLDYINIEEMEVDKPEDIDERVIEKTIVRNIKKFIMTFGRDFAYIGNQYHLEMKLLDSNEIRQLRDVCIFEVNGM